MKIVKIGRSNGVYCDTGQFEHRYRLSVLLYATAEEWELLRGAGSEVEFILQMPSDPKELPPIVMSEDRRNAVCPHGLHFGGAYCEDCHP